MRKHVKTYIHKHVCFADKRIPTRRPVQQRIVQYTQIDTPVYVYSFVSRTSIQADCYIYIHICICLRLCYPHRTNPAWIHSEFHNDTAYLDCATAELASNKPPHFGVSLKGSRFFAVVETRPRPRISHEDFVSYHARLTCIGLSNAI